MHRQQIDKFIDKKIQFQGVFISIRQALFRVRSFDIIESILQHIMLHPITKWAQRKERVYLEVQLRDIKNDNIELTESTLTFVGESDGHKYAFAFEFFDPIDKNASKWTKTGFHLIFVLEKADPNAAFWPRLLKTKEKNQYIQIDWSKWVDEDEEAEEPEKGLGGFDPSQMQGFGGGMPGMGGMGGMPGMGGMGGMDMQKMMANMGAMGGMGGMPGMGDMGNYDDEQEEEEDESKEKTETPAHVHGENCHH